MLAQEVVEGQCPGKLMVQQRTCKACDLQMSALLSPTHEAAASGKYKL
jgi:hypothetical protein